MTNNHRFPQPRRPPQVCIFAYGQTGSGKTYTMLGIEDNRGIIPRAIDQIFTSSRQLAAQGWTFNMQASMLEIYNEEYKDLLAKKGAPATKKHNVVHDANGNTAVSDLTLVDVNTPEAVAALLGRAMEKRSVGCTAMNEQSSRSHMVFTLRIDGANASSQLKVGRGSLPSWGVMSWASHTHPSCHRMKEHTAAD
jgi:kinesin family protein C1